jgi:REP element-mobilizing transposase RayT
MEMARQLRKRSTTGIYHVMLRGIDRRDIFLDDEDKSKFMEALVRAKEIGKFELYGYCLMDNHVHLLIKEHEDIGASVKRITVGYVGWHNKKHERTGHLFQNRYASEPVETESYLITVLRYIHQNPVKARIVGEAKDYLWSSYKQYILAYQQQNGYVDVYLIKTYFEELEDFIQFMNELNGDECLEFTVNKLSDADLVEFIHKEYSVNNLPELSIEERNRIIKDIYSRTGASIRQLGRIMGLGKTIIERAVKQDK